MVQAHAGMPSDVSNTETKGPLAGIEHPFLSKGHKHDKSATGLAEKVLTGLHLQTHHRLSSQGQRKGRKTLPLFIKPSKLLVVKHKNLANGRPSVTASRPCSQVLESLARGNGLGAPHDSSPNKATSLVLSSQLSHC